jgi:hypothetical protein
MDYPRDNVFTYLFSTYKKTAGIAFAVILILAIPITIALVGRQQDVRQRASESTQVSPTPTSNPAQELSPTSTPSATILEQRIFDFNDDGIVDDRDLNTLLFGFSHRTGD